MNKGVIRLVIARVAALALRLKVLLRVLVIFAVAAGCNLSSAAAGTETYQYDALGRLASVIYGNGTTINYAYDAAGNRMSSGPIASVSPVLSLTNCAASGTTTSPTKATYTCTLGNTGPSAATSVVYSSVAGTVTGPTSCGANTSNCGSVVVSSSASTGVYIGTLTATPNAGTSATTASFTLTVNASVPLPTISVIRTPNPMVATQSYTTTWSATDATTFGYSCSAAGTGYSGTGTLSTSGSSVGTAVTGWVGYSSSCTWTATGPGGTKTFSEILTTVNPAIANLTLSGCFNSGATTSPTKATYSCTLGNSGDGAASSVVYGSAAGSVSGPASCAANTANCGSVVVSSSTAAGSYSGTLTATPNVGTSATTASFTLTVNNPATAVLTLSGCVNSGTTTYPTPATYSCTLGNAGAGAASSVVYGSAAGSVSGPASCAANTANCGTVIVSSSTNAGAYTGVITATPNGGAAATSASTTLTVNKANSTSSLTITPTNPTAGVPISYVVAVSGINITGNVNYYLDGTLAAISPVVSNQTVVSQTGGTAAGSYVIQATYEGDSNHNASSTSTTNLSVGKANTTTTLNISPTNPVAGVPITYTATVAGGYSATGTVNFYLNGALAATAPVLSGTATVVQSGGASAGTYAISVGYLGDVNNNASNSATTNLTVAAAPQGTFAYVSHGGHSANGASGDQITFTVKNTGASTITGISVSCGGASFYNYGNFSTTSLAPNATGTQTCRAAASGGYNAARITMSGTGASNSGVLFGPY